MLLARTGVIKDAEKECVRLQDPSGKYPQFKLTLQEKKTLFSFSTVSQTLNLFGLLSWHGSGPTLALTEHQEDKLAFTFQERRTRQSRETVQRSVEDNASDFDEDTGDSHVNSSYFYSSAACRFI